MNFRYGLYVVIWIVMISLSGLVVFGLVEPSLPQDMVGQVRLGLVAAMIITAGMGAYAWVIFAGRDLSRARMAQMGYPRDIEDIALTTPVPESLAAIDQALKSGGFVLASERLGMKNSEGIPMVTWHYCNADSTAHALIALSPDGKDAGVIVTTYFADEMQLNTRLSRTIPKIEKPGFENHSVERVGEVVRVHEGHVQRLTAAHGNPLSLPTFADEQRLAQKTYTLTRSHLFDALWRRNMIWLASVEGVGLWALVGGMTQLVNPALSPIRGLTMLAGGAALIATLTVAGVIALRRVARRR